MKRIVRENGLSLVLFVLFFLSFLVGQSITGYHVDKEERQEKGEPQIGYADYLKSPHFLEATMENWESEFLQMFVFVLLSVFLVQKGSAESRKLEGEEEVDEDPRKHRKNKTAPWPVRTGGLWLKLYECSLSLAFALLFLVAFVLHSLGGAGVYNQEQIAKGREAVSAIGYMGTPRFWFESLQNWQSEFLAIGAMVVLTIFLRQRGSPQSKPVHAPHARTGK
jgi:hypothetical protein